MRRVNRDWIFHGCANSTRGWTLFCILTAAFGIGALVYVLASGFVR